jgi:hypothetical protein
MERKTFKRQLRSDTKKGNYLVIEYVMICVKSY